MGALRVLVEPAPVAAARARQRRAYEPPPGGNPSAPARRRPLAGQRGRLASDLTALLNPLVEVADRGRVAARGRRMLRRNPTLHRLQQLAGDRPVVAKQIQVGLLGVLEALQGRYASARYSMASG